MTKRLILSLAALLTLCGAMAQTQQVGSDKLLNFRKVSLSGKMKVTLRPVEGQDKTSVMADLTTAEAERFEYKVADGTLTVKIKSPKKGEPETTPAVEICYAELAALDISSSEVVLDGAWSGGAVDLSVSNAGRLTGNIELKDIDISMSEKSLVTLEGRAKYVNASVSTTSRLDMRKTENVDFTVRAATNAEVYLLAGERIVARAATNASVMYKGRPDILRDKNSMGGKVSNIGE